MTALDKSVAAWRRSQDAERERAARVYELIAAAAADGATEMELVRQTGLARMTVRRAMGKPVSK